MEIRKIEINMHQGYANSPTFVVHVDKIPKLDEFVYKEIILNVNTALYWAEKDSYVSFYCHNNHNEHGYGGSNFTLKLTDGTIKIIKGPWSSRAGVMNKYFAQCVDVKYIDDEDYHYSGAILLDTLLKYTSVKYSINNGETIYEPDTN